MSGRPDRNCQLCFVWFVSIQLGQSESTQLSPFFSSLPLVYHVPIMICNSTGQKNRRQLLVIAGIDVYFS